jgi:hypothetical protein
MYSPIALWIQKAKKHQSIEVDNTPKTMTWTNELSVPEKETQVRMLRNQLIALTDYTQLSDAPASINKEEWAVYRQELRDVTLQAGFPDNIVWPKAPN